MCLGSSPVAENPHPTRLGPWKSFEHPDVGCKLGSRQRQALAVRMQAAAVEHRKMRVLNRKGTQNTATLDFYRHELVLFAVAPHGIKEAAGAIEIPTCHRARQEQPLVTSIRFADSHT